MRLVDSLKVNPENLTGTLKAARDNGFHCVDEAEFQQQCQSCLWWFTEDKINDGICGLECPADCSHESDEVLISMVKQIHNFDFRDLPESVPQDLRNRTMALYFDHVFDIQDRESIFQGYEKRLALGMENKVLKFAQEVEAMQ